MPSPRSQPCWSAPKSASVRLFQHQHQRFGRMVPQDDSEQGGPARHRGRATAPVVDLPGGDAGETGERGLAQVGAGQQGGEFRA